MGRNSLVRPVAVMFCDSKGMLRDRIVALRKANIYAPHFYRHLVSNTRILGEQAGVITAQTNYGVFQTLLDGETRQFLAIVPYEGLSPMRVGASAGVAAM